MRVLSSIGESESSDVDVQPGRVRGLVRLRFQKEESKKRSSKKSEVECPFFLYFGRHLREVSKQDALRELQVPEENSFLLTGCSLGAKIEV